MLAVSFLILVDPPSPYLPLWGCMNNNNVLFLKAQVCERCFSGRNCGQWGQRLPVMSRQEIFIFPFVMVGE